MKNPLTSLRTTIKGKLRNFRTKFRYKVNFKKSLKRYQKIKIAQKLSLVHDHLVQAFIQIYLDQQLECQKQGYRFKLRKKNKVIFNYIYLMSKLEIKYSTRTILFALETLSKHNVLDVFDGSSQQISFTENGRLFINRKKYFILPIYFLRSSIKRVKQSDPIQPITKIRI